MLYTMSGFASLCQLLFTFSTNGRIEFDLWQSFAVCQEEVPISDLYYTRGMAIHVPETFILMPDEESSVT